MVIHCGSHALFNKKGGEWGCGGNRTASLLIRVHALVLALE